MLHIPTRFLAVFLGLAATICGAAEPASRPAFPQMGPRDADGWAVFTPPKDARIIYVSSSQGDDRNPGTSPSRPFKTLARGKSFIRNEKGDWLLLKRGDGWYESLGNWTASGKSADEPALIGTYGDGPRPVLKTGTSSGITFHGGGGAPPTKDHVAIVGIEFYAHTRDPSAPEFGDATSKSQSSGLLFLRQGRNLLIEDCAFRFYKDNLQVQGEGDGLYNFTLRRSVIVDSYYSEDAHSQGIYMYNVHGALFEENVFDHNGWNEQIASAQATIFNHNMYIDEGNSDVTVRRNVIARASSHGMQVRCGGTVEDNLFAGNAIALYLGNSAERGSLVRRNAIVDGTEITSLLPRGWGLEVNNDFGALTTLVLEENTIVNVRQGQNGPPLALNGGHGPVLTRNLIFNWGVSHPTGSGYAKAVLSDNQFGLSATEYIDPTRSMADYNVRLGGARSLDAFLVEARTQGRTNWRDEYTAGAARRYLTEGFNRAR